MQQASLSMCTDFSHFIRYVLVILPLLIILFCFFFLATVCTLIFSTPFKLTFISRQYAFRVYTGLFPFTSFSAPIRSFYFCTVGAISHCIECLSNTSNRFASVALLLCLCVCARARVRWCVCAH